MGGLALVSVQLHQRHQHIGDGDGDGILQWSFWRMRSNSELAFVERSIHLGNSLGLACAWLGGRWRPLTNRITISAMCVCVCVESCSAIMVNVLMGRVRVFSARNYQRNSIALAVK